MKTMQQYVVLLIFASATALSLLYVLAHLIAVS